MKSKILSFFAGRKNMLVLLAILKLNYTLLTEHFNCSKLISQSCPRIFQFNGVNVCGSATS